MVLCVANTVRVKQKANNIILWMEMDSKAWFDLFNASVCVFIFRKSSCPQHAKETNQNWVSSFLLDCAVWEEYQIHRWRFLSSFHPDIGVFKPGCCWVSFPLCRSWWRIHRNPIQRQSGGKEIPGILYKVRSSVYNVGSVLLVFVLNVLHSPVNREDVVVAAASLMFDPAVARLAELMATGQTLTKAQAQWVHSHRLYCLLQCLQ